METDKIEEFLNRTSSGQFMGHITQVVDDKIRKHLEKKYKEPKYIKMPIWCLNELKRARMFFETPMKFDGTEPYYNGMRICETETIKEMNEIEVF